MLFVEGRAPALELFGAASSRPCPVPIPAEPLPPSRLRIELLLVFLESLGADAEGFLFLVEAVAAVAVALVQLFADLAQLAAQRSCFLELLLGALDARRTIPAFGDPVPLAVPPGLFASLEVAFLFLETATRRLGSFRMAAAFGLDLVASAIPEDAFLLQFLASGPATPLAAAISRNRSRTAGARLRPAAPRWT